MKLKLWLHRLRGLKIKGFQRRSISTAAAATSVCHLDTIEKSTVNSSLELTPVNYRKNSSTHISISPKVSLSLSPTSPLPSPALLNTPNGRSSSLVLKESLAFDSAADYAFKNKPYNKFAQVVASLGFGSTGAPLGSVSLRKGRLKNSKAFGGISKGFKDEDGIKGSLKGSDSENTMEIDHKEEGSCLHQASTRRWAGACRCCMLVNIEKGLVRSKRGALGSRAKLKKKQSKHTESTELMLSSEHKSEIKDLNIADYHPVLLTTTSIKEPHFVTSSTQPAFVKAAELVEKHADWKSDITEVTVSRRWSSASVRDCYNAIPIPSEPKLVRSSSSYACSKEKSSITDYDDNLFITSFDRGRPASESSMSTLSSDEFDKLNHWGSCDSKNGHHLTHGHWQEELDVGNLDQKIRKNSQRSAFSLYNQGIISANTQSGLGSDHEEDERESLLQADSYATCSVNSSYTWLHQNIDDDDASYKSTVADLEANAKVWATWVSSSIAKAESNYGSSIKHDYGNSVTKSHAEAGLSSRIKSRRELDAAALRRKYHKEFGQQAIVVSSHHGDNMNTFVFPSEIPRAEPAANPSQVITEKLKENINIHSQRNELIIKVGLDSLAVEKRSQDPYVDFRDSMVDMILQNQMHKSSDLEELLQSFLSLNSLEHHDLIVQAFIEVWEKVFGNFSIRKP